MQSDRMVVKGGLTLDMPLPEEVVDHLAEAIRGSEASGLAWSGTKYPYMLNEWLGEERAMRCWWSSTEQIFQEAGS